MRGRAHQAPEWLRELKTSPKASPSWQLGFLLGTCNHGAGTASLSGAGTSPEWRCL